MIKKIKIECFIAVLMTIFIMSCSTTKNLPVNEQLYIGMEETQFKDTVKSKYTEQAIEEIDAAISAAPNSALFGSSSVRIPFPMGLWIYNDFINSKSKFGKWVFKKFSSKPILISSVNPDTRIKVASNILREWGYFSGFSSYKIIPHKSDERKAKIEYSIAFGKEYKYDTIIYKPFNYLIDSIITSIKPSLPVQNHDIFNVLKLDKQKSAISENLRNNGFYYFRPSYIDFYADTVARKGAVELVITPNSSMPENASHQWTIEDMTININGIDGEQPNNSLMYKDLKINYFGNKPPVRPRILYNRFRIYHNNLYSLEAEQKTLANLATLRAFSYSQFNYAPCDTISEIGRLDVNINSQLEKPINGDVKLNLTLKSNNYTGPGAEFGFSKNNIFRGGETLSLTLGGSYEWQTGRKDINVKQSLLNSYSLSMSMNISVPRLLFPWSAKKDRNYLATSTYKIYAEQLNRAKFYKMLSFGGDASYSFQKTITKNQTFTPLKLNYNLLQKTTHTFDSIANENPALYESMRNQFIPSINYSYTYDNSKTDVKNISWWNITVSEAGNIISGVYAAAGKSFNDEKKLLGNPFAQYVKFSTEYRYHWKLDKNNIIASRVMGGIIYAYGNSKVAPYTEQFYIGGANSIRAFTVRSIGPGGYIPLEGNKYSYIDQTGDIKLEANIEYRFRILQDLWGATFMDAGNIWLLRKDPSRPNGELNIKGFGKEIALGTGVGLRYDFSVIVLRLDMGIGLHLPYDTGKKGYYNIPNFKDGIGVHFAIGYPF